MDLSALRRASRARLAPLSRQAGAPRRHRVVLVFAALALLAGLATGCAPAPAQVRVDLRVLLLNDGTPTPGFDGIREQLKLEGIPFREVNTTEAGRPTIDAAFLSTSYGTDPIIDQARYQAVVSDSEELTGLSAEEKAALFAFESKFGVRHVHAWVWSNPNVGLNWPTWSGAIGDQQATVTEAAKSAGFGYLPGSTRFSPDLNINLATPLSPLPEGATYTPYLTVPIPGTADVGSLAGVYANGGRQELFLTGVFALHQPEFRAVLRGVVNWMTKGIHLGYSRNYLTVHVDDLYAEDARWNSDANCTPTEDCPPGVPEGTKIRMTPADVAATLAWQEANGFTLDMVYNGFGADSWIAEHGSDPLLNATVAAKGKFAWINHTYTHLFLGCEQDHSVIPWRCKTNAAGQIVYVPLATIVDEINKNKAFATTHGLPINPAELVTGEHSGLFILPQQPSDNPNLAPAFYATGIANTGADASRQFDTRLVGNTRTVPRYPMQNFYNVGTKAEMADEWNWLQTSAADGGSGACTAGGWVCRPPIDVNTGYDEVIVPLDTELTLQRMLANDPRPHYVHQSNLAEDRILLPLMTSILNKYRSLYNSTAPVKRISQTEAADLLVKQSEWKTGVNQVEAFTLNGVVYVNKNGYSGPVPLTVPTGARVDVANGPVFGEVYAGESSAWVNFNGTYRVVLGTQGA